MCVIIAELSSSERDIRPHLFSYRLMSLVIRYMTKANCNEAREEENCLLCWVKNVREPIIIRIMYFLSLVYDTLRLGSNKAQGAFEWGTRNVDYFTQFSAVIYINISLGEATASDYEFI